jgi:hypothetical protein
VWLGLRRLDLVEHGFRSDVPRDLLELAIDIGPAFGSKNPPLLPNAASASTPMRSATADTSVTSLVTSCSVSRLI